jgi:thioredoxin type arsenate reductase
MRGILFLCVANSARSQMAEGLAKAVIPPEIEVWSAGSSPKQVRPEAVEVMQEIGLDISNHQSKSITDIPASKVDMVITLCSEEVCPAFLGKAERVHWPLPDPGSVHGAHETRLEAFRRVRDELRRRIELLVGSIDDI